MTPTAQSSCHCHKFFFFSYSALPPLSTPSPPMLHDCKILRSFLALPKSTLHTADTRSGTVLCHSDTRSGTILCHYVSLRTSAEQVHCPNHGGHGPEQCAPPLTHFLSPVSTHAGSPGIMGHRACSHPSSSVLPTLSARVLSSLCSDTLNGSSQRDLP